MKTFKEPTTQDIIDHLNEQEAAGPGFASQEELDEAVKRELTPFDLSKATEEERAVLEGKTMVQTKEDEPKADTPVPQEFVMPGTSDELDFTMDFNDLGQVEVPDEERDLYLKSLLNDTQYELPIEVFPGFMVTVRSRTVFYDDLIYDMVRAKSERGEVLGLESGFTKLMRLLAGVQILRINGESVAFDPPEGLPRTQVAEMLNQHVQKTFDKFALAKWNALVKAVRVFDSKQKICNDRILDRSFWEGANTN